MLELRMLGPVEALVDDRSVPLGPPQQRALLATLGLRPGTVHGVDALIGALWGERPPGSAVNIVQGYVAGLRALLEPGRDRGAPAGLLLTRPPGYLLALPAEATDVGRFQLLVERAREVRERDPAAAAATLREALGLWRGEALADLGDLPVAVAARAHLDELRRTAHAERVDADLDAGRAAELVAELEALVAAHPLAERGYRQLMLALYRAGRQADALAAYANARRALADELGVDPGPELRALETAILRHEVPPPSGASASVPPAAAGSRAPPAAAGSRALPAALTSFVGRAAELAELRALLTERRLVTLTGPGGAGKTRLALELAAGVGPDVHLVDLVPVTDPDAVPAAVAAALGVRAEPGRSVPDTLRDCLRGERALLLLDNCEHVLDGCAVLVDHLLPAAPGLRVLATSRQPLGVVGEAAWPVPGLDEDTAVRLFAERAAASFRLTPDTEAVVRRVCRRLDGMPLAVELAAARTRMLSPAEIEVRLDDRFGLLGAARRGGPARHRTLAAVIDWSYRLLDGPERELFERLSVFAGGFDLAGARAVAPAASSGSDPVASSGSSPDPVDTLAALVDKSLVTRTEGVDGRSRYRLLDTLRQFARSRLDERGVTGVVLARHAGHLVEVAERNCPLVPGPAAPGWLDRLREDAADLAAAVTWSLYDGDGSAAVQIMAGAWWLWWVRGPLEQGRVLLEEVLGRAGAADGRIAAEADGRIADGADVRTRARLLYGVGSFALTQGDLDRVEQVGRECHALGTAHGNELAAGWGLACQGLAGWARGDYPGGRRYIEQALAHAERGDDRWHVALSLAGLGRLAADDGDDERAGSLLAAASRAAREAGRAQALGFALDQVATLAYRQGRDADAVRAAREAEAAYRDAGSQEGIGAALRTVGRVALRAGDLREAAALHRERLVVYRRHGNRGPLAACLEDLAEVAVAVGRPAEATRLLAAADALRADHGTPLPAPDRADHERRLAVLRAEPGFAEAWADGRALSLDAALIAAEHVADQT